MKAGNSFSEPREEGTVFSLILAPLRGNFPTRHGASQYGKLKPLKDSPLLPPMRMPPNTGSAR